MNSRVSTFLSYNIFISFALLCPFLFESNSFGELTTLLYSLVIQVAQVLTFYFLIATLSMLIFFKKKENIFSAALLIGAVSFLNYFFIVDFVIYKMFRFHFNSLAWNVISTPEGIASMNLPPSMFYVVFGLLGFIILVQSLLYFKVARNNFPLSNPLKINGFYKALSIYFLFFVLVDKLVYAYSDIRNDISLTKAGKFYPLYFPLLIRNDADALLGLAKNEVTSSKGQSKLNYPKQETEHNLKDNAPNVMMIVLDSWRFDQLDNEVTPFTFELAEKNYNYVNHHSGGNGTRNGVFSLMYGLHSSYWQRFLSERKSPEIITALKKEDYKFKILSSASLKSPEFRLTAFVDIVESIEDEYSIKPMWKRDKKLVERFKDFTSELAPDDSFFSFILFDATHSGFSYPSEYEKFKPVTPEGSFAKMIAKDNAKFTKNRYKNSIYYVDTLIKEVVEDLKKKGLYHNTMLVITGDHGEEFYEAGYFGHHGAFTEYQTRVPLVIKMPGEERAPLKVSKLTSHQDIVPTIMNQLGSNEDISKYSNGKVLTDPNYDNDFILSCSFYDCSIVHEEGHIIFGIEAHTLMRFEVRDPSYKIIRDKDNTVKKNTSKIVKAIQETGEFLK